MMYHFLTLAFYMWACLAHVPNTKSHYENPRDKNLDLNISSQTGGALNISSNLFLTRRQSNESDNSDKPARLANATISEIEKARSLIAEAIKMSSVQNKARVSKPMRNQYILDPDTKLANLERRKADEGDVTSLFNITDELRNAAALVAEADAYEESKNATGVADEDAKAQAAGDWWMGNITHSGGWPWGNNPTGFKVCFPNFLVGNWYSCQRD